MMSRAPISPPLLCCMLLLLAGYSALGQETVFSIMKSDNRRASELFSSRRYREAARLYESMADRAPNAQYYLALARAHYYLHEPAEAARWYEKYIGLGSDLPA